MGRPGAAAQRATRGDGVSFGAQLGAVLRKDLLLALRGRGRILSHLLFALTVLLLFSFAAGPNRAVLQRHAAGYLWLAILLGSTLSLAESIRVEIEDGALTTLRLFPTDARAWFLGKALAHAAVLGAITVVLVPVAIGLYAVEPRGPLWALAGSLFLGVLALTGVGTLHSTLAAQTRGKDVLLPLLLYPVVVPVLVGGVKATALSFEGDPMAQAGSWLLLLLCFDLVTWAASLLLVERVLEA